MSATTRGIPFLQGGEDVNVDQVWRASDDFTPGEHRNWLGMHVKDLADAGAIVGAGWRVTEHSAPHSRPARLWVGKRAEVAA